MRQFGPLPLVAVLSLMGLLVAGCAVKPLKAPCSRDEAPMQPMAYAGLGIWQLPPTGVDHCGEMRPVNELAPFGGPAMARPPAP